MASNKTNKTKTVSVPTKGTLLNSYCKEVNKLGVYADGKGDSYTRVIKMNSPECGYKEKKADKPVKPVPAKKITEASKKPVEEKKATIVAKVATPVKKALKTPVKPSKEESNNTSSMPNEFFRQFMSVLS